MSRPLRDLYESVVIHHVHAYKKAIANGDVGGAMDAYGVCRGTIEGFQTTEARKTAATRIYIYLIQNATFRDFADPQDYGHVRLFNPNVQQQYTNYGLYQALPALKTTLQIPVNV